MRLFAMANRGSYIAVAAPGVDILALAPGDALQITTGTSVATAHVSGLAALLLECKPSLKPAEIRTMLAGTAKPLGSGAGLVNAYRAVTFAQCRSVGQGRRRGSEAMIAQTEAARSLSLLGDRRTVRPCANADRPSLPGLSRLKTPRAGPSPGAGPRDAR